MPSGSRQLLRQLAASQAAFYLLSASGTIEHVSEAAAAWLGIAPTSLLGRRAISGSPRSDDPMDRLAAALSPPPNFWRDGFAGCLLQPAGIGTHTVQPTAARFVRLGSAPQAVALVVIDDFAPLAQAEPIADSIAIRQALDAWRKHEGNWASIATAGTSSAAKRLRAKIQLAAKLRCHVGLFGPRGCSAETIAIKIHSQSAPGELLVVVEGSLMDDELLEATIAPAIQEVTEGRTRTASLLIRALDEMPMEVQSQLAISVGNAAGRLRLFALCSPQPRVFREGQHLTNELVSVDESIHLVEPRLADWLSLMPVHLQSLSSRVEDLTLIATAMLDARRAAGEGTAERFSRAALDALIVYPWPGDYDELDGAIRHAVRVCGSEAIGIEHLPLVVRSYRTKPVEPKPVSLDDALQRFEKRLIQEAVVAADGNRAEAARRLGISRARLLRRLDEAGP
jgi:hypothetical protein